MTSQLSMFNWDVISAVTFSKANEVIAASSTIPDSFEKKRTSDVDSSTEYSASGTFSSWQLALGGSAAIVKMNLTLPTLSCSTSYGDGAYTATTDYTDCTAEIELELQYVPQSSDSSKSDLTNSTTAVTVNSCTGTTYSSSQQKDITTSVDGNGKDTLEVWLNANLGDFYTVFATVDIEPDYSDDALKWLTPTYKSYAVSGTDATSLDEAVFAVLMLVDDSTYDSSVQETNVDAAILPDGADAVLLISEYMFLKNMFISGVPIMFDGIEDDDIYDHFTIDNSNTRITNTGDLKFSEVELDNGDKVKPTISAGEFEIQLETTEIKISVTRMKVKVDGNDIVAYITYTGTASLGLDTSDNTLSLSVLSESSDGTLVLSTAITTADAILSWGSLAVGLVGSFGGAISKIGSAVAKTTSEVTLEAAEAAAEDLSTAQSVAIKMCKTITNGDTEKLADISTKLWTVAKYVCYTALAGGLADAVIKTMEASANDEANAKTSIISLTSGVLGSSVLWPSEISNFTLISVQMNGPVQFGFTVTSS